MTESINLNYDWLYSESGREEMVVPDYDDSKFDQVSLPHTNRVTPYHYFDEECYQFVSCYRRHFFARQEWRNKLIYLCFEAIGHVAVVYINGHYVMTHEGGYTAFRADLTPYLKPGEDNVIAVIVDSRESNNLPPFGNVIDYMTYGGIYREVSLEVKEPTFIEDAYIMTNDAKGAVLTQKEVQLWITLGGEEPDNTKLWKNLSLKYSVIDAKGKLIYQNNCPTLDRSLKLSFLVEGVEEWEPEHPVLYYLKLELLSDGMCESVVDRKELRFGFRTCEFKQDGFYLNRHKLKLIGLNRHQSFPYVGYAMPKRQQQRDAEILKYELGVNAVRTSHYPQSRYFLDRCDELGLLVFTEIPGWQHIGDQEWKEKAVHQVEEMVLQYRNHPSIILWGVRINESQDDDEFYERTNRLARELDPARQTGGVRYLQKSKLLEDVYTYNDFLHNGTNPGLSKMKEITSETSAPYLVTEFNGHMFPTKTFDDEPHRLEHALRHARVLDALFAQEEISGAFGWCMFDYNTHKDFGSGDRICYHGVMDMFRNPKLAAAVYASQQEDADVFELSTSLDIGDYPAGNIHKVYAFTNADCICVYKNEILIKEFFPSKERFSHLKHPPILIDDFVGELLEKEEHFSHGTAESMKQILYAVKEYGQGNLPLRFKLKMAWLMIREHLTLEDGTRLYYKYIGSWGGQLTSFRFEAIRKGKVVKTIIRTPCKKPSLVMIPDTLQLLEETSYDAAAVRIRAVDEWGNTLPYYQEPLELKAEGSIEIIGPSFISLKGGMGGTYVRTKKIAGEGILTVRSSQLGEYRLLFYTQVRGE